MNNYDAWNVSLDNPPKNNSRKEILNYLIKFAVLAPSSHNSQPWSFQITDAGIGVYLAQKRILPIGDPDNRLSLISIGAAIENIITAARALGLTAGTKIAHIETDPLIATIEITGKVKSNHDKQLLSSIVNRVTMRSPYENKPYKQEFIDEIKKNALTSNTTLHIITDTEKKAQLAEIITDSSISMMGSKTFRKELSSHVLSNTSNKPVGMPAAGMGIPNLVSYFVPFLLKHFNMQKLSKNEDMRTLTQGSPALFIITTVSDTIADKIHSGMVFEQISLLATTNHMRTSVWGAGTADSLAREKVSNLFGINEVPQLIFRVGIPKIITPHSPRLSAADVVESI